MRLRSRCTLLYGITGAEARMSWSLLYTPDRSARTSIWSASQALRCWTLRPSSLTWCRQEGIEVIHLRASFSPYRSDWMPKYLLRGRTPCVQGTAGIEPLPFASERVGETILLKHTFDGFQNGELEQYLHQRGKRFVLTAGLLTSTCVLLTSASAMQKGFLVALVEDCCADEPEAHKHTLDHYRFIFEQTPVGLITSHHAEWMAALEQLDAFKASFQK
jgi:ureidoacrylate peracid hydrolase